ncbi:hypothetical protein BL252_06535 [Salmonella enterica]|nr:hypothetical protein [Salmonella enterica]
MFCYQTQREVVMETQKDMVASLLEELVIARGLVKEICKERNIPVPNASLQRMEKAIEDAKEYLLESN